MAVTAVMVAHAQAAPVTYNFTATLKDGEDTYFGTTVVGTVTLDPSAPPTYSAYLPPLFIYGIWADGAFAINIITDTGFMAGTSDGGTTRLNSDVYFWSSQERNQLIWTKHDGVIYQTVVLNSVDARTDAYAPAAVPDPWTPLANPSGPLFHVTYFDEATYEGHTAEFQLTSFEPSTPVTPKILIDGKDTGITDITYQGQSVNATIAGYASSAKNHGNFVSSVTQLANALKKDGLITEAQKSTLTSTAAQSSVGKKAKKK